MLWFSVLMSQCVRIEHTKTTLIQKKVERMITFNLAISYDGARLNAIIRLILPKLAYFNNTNKYILWSLNDLG